MGDNATELQDQQALVQGLRVSVYSLTDPAADEALLARLADEEKKLAEMMPNARAVAPAAPVAQESPAEAKMTPHFLGQATTGVVVETQVRLRPLPTGIYHLLDPAKNPLLTVTVTNKAREARRIRVTAYIEGLSASAVKTLELKRNEKVPFDMHPTLLPDRARMVTEVQWATLHVIVDILGNTLEDAAPGKQPYAELCECHNTLPILCLARTSSFNSTRDPVTGEVIDLSRYYGAWVTPNVPAVQHCIRHAATLHPDKQMWGYQGKRTSVTGQVKALYDALKAANVTYINSVIDFGAAEGQFTQRTRLPRESLEFKSANCIDGTVLMASLLEAVSLNPAIVLVPGHAFLGWETWPGTNKFEFLETTMIGSYDFDAACVSGKRQYEKRETFYDVQPLSLAQLRREGIYPME